MKYLHWVLHLVEITMIVILLSHSVNVYLDSHEVEDSDIDQAEITLRNMKEC